MWLWIWLGFVLFLLLVPFAYGWGCRRLEEAPAAGDELSVPPDARGASFEERDGAAVRLEVRFDARERGAVSEAATWRWLPELLWLSALVLLAWVVLAITVA